MKNYTTTVKMENSRIEKAGCNIEANNIQEAVSLIESMGAKVLSASEEYQTLVYSV